MYKSLSMLRSLSRATPSSSKFLGASIRTAIRPATPILNLDIHYGQARQSSGHAISNPTLAGIEKRWETMPPQEQAELWMALRDRMKNDWHELTLQEKKAAYWVAFGPHGPRALPPPGEGRMIFLWTMTGVAISFVIFVIIRSFARPGPGTMNQQYQEMTNEYLKNQKTEAISGVSSEGYTGKGQVQSKPKRE